MRPDVRRAIGRPETRPRPPCVRPIVDIIRAFRIVSIAEAVSFLVLLLIAMPLKYMGDAPAAVQITGPIHGILFLAYVGLVFFVREQLRWDPKRTVLALGASVLPVAPFLVEHFWARPAAAPGVAGSLGEPAGRA